MMALHLRYTDGRPPEAEVIFYPEGEYAMIGSIMARNRQMDELLREGIRAKKEDKVESSVFVLRYTKDGEEITEEWRIMLVNDLWDSNYMASPSGVTDAETIRTYDEYSQYHRKRVDLIRRIVRTQTKAEDLWAQGLITEEEMKDATE